MTDATPPTPGSGASPLRPLVRSWWLIALAIAASVLASAWITSRQQPVYRATATLVVAPSASLEANADVLRSIDTLERRGVVATFAKIPGARETMEKVAAELGVEPAALRGTSLSASVPPYTYVVLIEARGRDPQQVADVANAAARVADRRAVELYRIFSLQPLAAAQVPYAPVYPQPRRNMVVAVLVGVFAGVVAAYALAAFRPDR
jgi:capsular polysaccharide biosynthesis protein